MDSRAVAAARNNAEWCDLVCRSHAIDTTFEPEVWAALRRSPPLYPDAVTLSDRLSARDVVRRVDSSGGCSVKDSFASVELSSEGFRVLFDAEWIYHEPAEHQAEVAAGWSTVRTPEQLRTWAAVHGGGDVFRPALVNDAAVAIVFAYDDQGDVAAGAIGNRSASVVGISNVFTLTAAEDDAWAGAIAAISARFPGMPLVGYERDRDLSAAHRAGFVSVGLLRVWLRD
jgi:hypothetical protein